MSITEGDGVMDWISGLQCAIDYVEEHLTDEIIYEEVAKRACSSVFHFQRVFSTICGYTIGDYIRYRRLSLAGSELAATKAKVIDVAFKYGYDSPESFSRAFAKFHGVSPSDAKNGRNIKSFSALSVKLILYGGNTMDYRIEKRKAFKIVCKKQRVNKPQGDTATADISAFWGKCSSDGTMPLIMKYASFENFHGILGICFSGEMADSGFPYGIGAEYNGNKVAEPDLEIVEIPAHTYAVFTCKGKMPEAFKETYKRICTEFFPQSSEYRYGNGIELEVYPSDDVTNSDYTCEIWIAVEKKN